MQEKVITYQFTYDEDSELFALSVNGREEDDSLTSEQAERYAQQVTQFHGLRNEPFYILWD